VPFEEDGVFMDVRSGYKQSEVGVIPRDWQVVALDKLAKPGRPAVKAGPFGSSLTKDTYVAQGYKIYGQEQVIRGDHLYGDYYIARAKYNELKSCSVEPGDILLSLVGTAGRVLVIPTGAPQGIINPRVIRFSFDTAVISSAFFQFLFESAHYQSLLTRRAQGGTMGILNGAVLRPIPITLPRLAEQEAIAEALADANALIESLERVLAKKRQLKQGAMHELLTGKKRLPGFGGEWTVKRVAEIAFPSSEKNVSGEDLPVLTCSKHLGFVDSLV
jgi:type I restriction enzyme, S subunit